MKNIKKEHEHYGIKQEISETYEHAEESQPKEEYDEFLLSLSEGERDVSASRSWKHVKVNEPQAQIKPGVKENKKRKPASPVIKKQKVGPILPVRKRVTSLKKELGYAQASQKQGTIVLLLPIDS